MGSMESALQSGCVGGEEEVQLAETEAVLNNRASLCL